MKWIILLLGLFSNASASVFIKIAVTDKSPVPEVTSFLQNFLNPYMVLGLGLYGSAFIFYSIALTYLPLNIAHPILTGGSIALVSIASVLILGEALTFFNILGITLIILGVTVLTVSDI
jgi:small multidrug resistance pump